jgi:ribosomal protein S18 acetylase RimI-like enzyme
MRRTIEVLKSPSARYMLWFMLFCLGATHSDSFAFGPSCSIPIPKPIPIQSLSCRHSLSSRRTRQLYLFWDNNNNKEEETPKIRDFFIRPSILADTGRASKILADGFYKKQTNCITYQYQRFETYLSLEEGLPKRNTMHQLFVACDQSSGQVLGLAEVDARLGGAAGSRGQNGPYMCNLAVDEGCRRMGIASALVRQCEQQVQDWHVSSDAKIANSLYLKVRLSNEVAIEMYGNKMGYKTFRLETDDKTGESVLVMRKEFPIETVAMTSITPDTNTTTVRL